MGKNRLAGVGFSLLFALVTSCGGGGDVDRTSGNTGGSADTQGPAVSFDAPAGGATVSGTSVLVSVTATDASGIADVTLMVDGTTYSTSPAGSGPYAFAWDTTGTANGTRTLQVCAHDKSPAANLGCSEKRSVTVNNGNPDTTPPSVSVVFPAAGGTVSGTVTLAASASDAQSGVRQVQFKLDGTNLGPAITVAPYTYSWDSRGVANGSHALAVEAIDNSGNSAVTSAVTFTVNNATTDSTAPSVVITAPASGAGLTGTALLTVSASDTESGVAGVQFKVDGVVVGYEATSPPYQLSWDSSTFQNGSHVVTAVARDNAGNSATSAAVTVTTSNATLTIPTPTNLKVVKGDGEFPQNMMLTWNKNTNVSYTAEMELSTTSDATGFSQAQDRLGGAKYDSGSGIIVTPGASTYWLRVKTCATSLRCSGYSNVVSIVMGPDLYAPSNVVGTEVASAISAARRAVKITWTNNSTTATGYQLRCLAGPANNIQMPPIDLFGVGLSQGTVDDLNPGDRFGCAVIPTLYDASHVARQQGPSRSSFPVTLTP